MRLRFWLDKSKNLHLAKSRDLHDNRNDGLRDSSLPIIRRPGDPSAQRHDNRSPTRQKSLIWHLFSSFDAVFVYNWERSQRNRTNQLPETDWRMPCIDSLTYQRRRYLLLPEQVERVCRDTEYSCRTTNAWTCFLSFTAVDGNTDKDNIIKPSRHLSAARNFPLALQNRLNNQI